MEHVVPSGAGPVCVTVPTSDPLAFYMGADGRFEYDLGTMCSWAAGERLSPPTPLYLLL